MPVVNNTEFGSEGYKNNVRKFGRREAAPAAPTIVWDGVTPYAGWLENEDTIIAVSSDINDAPGLNGVQYLQWSGQGADGIEKTYSLMLNGTTPVESATLDPGVKFDVVYTALCLNVEGSNLSPTVLPANRGDITITSKTTGAVLAVIKAGLGRTQMMIWRCPADHFAEFHKISVYPDGIKALLAQLWVRDGKTLSWLVAGQIDIDNNIASITHAFPDYISPGTDICLVGIPEQAATNISAQMWIKKKPIPEYEKLLEQGEI